MTKLLTTLLFSFVGIGSTLYSHDTEPKEETKQKEEKTTYAIAKERFRPHTLSLEYTLRNGESEDAQEKDYKMDGSIQLKYTYKTLSISPESGAYASMKYMKGFGTPTPIKNLNYYELSLGVHGLYGDKPGDNSGYIGINYNSLDTAFDTQSAFGIEIGGMGFFDKKLKHGCAVDIVVNGRRAIGEVSYIYYVQKWKGILKVKTALFEHFSTPGGSRTYDFFPLTIGWDQSF